MRLFPTPLERATDDHNRAIQRCVTSEVHVKYTGAVLIAERLLFRAYQQKGTSKPWVNYEQKYDMGDIYEVRFVLDTIQARLDKRKAITRREVLDNSINVEGVELAPATQLTETIAVHAPQTPMEALAEHMRDYMTHMFYLDNERHR